MRAGQFAPVVRTQFATTIAREPHRPPTFRDQVLKPERRWRISVIKGYGRRWKISTDVSTKTQVFNLTTCKATGILSGRSV